MELELLDDFDDELMLEDVLELLTELELVLELELMLLELEDEE